MIKSETRGEKTMLIKGDFDDIILREARPGLLVVELPLTRAFEEPLVEEEDPVL